MPTINQVPVAPVKVTVNNRGGILSPVSTGYVTLNGMTPVSSGGGASQLAQLTDVNLTSTPPTDHSTLVYNANTSKYDVTQLSLDGGTF